MTIFTRWRLGTVLAMLCAIPAGAQTAGTSTGAGGYTPADACAGCHPAQWDSYRRTGMGRSFTQPDAQNRIPDLNKPYFHTASATYYVMTERDGKFFQQQYQLDFDGKRTNFSELPIDFIVGSGNHSRTYLHRTSRNTLIELPLAWYSEKGGYWAMNPGYDRPDHQGLRRLIGDDCMFCHNAYPEIPADPDRTEPVFTRVPEGIDCQRCHGPGERHVRLARSPTAARTDVRAAIVNPARLAPDRQKEICLQCHLETTSFPLPNSIVRYERAPFSYRPGEPFSDFMLHFDRSPASDQADRFEIAGSAYRLDRSACFRKSNGALTCTTCHDPHDTPRGEAAARHYTAVCRQCHGPAIDRLTAAGKHTASGDCVGCHMPKRRTTDVVHAVMTDHFIQRQKPARDLAADIAEQPGDAHPYRGEVVLYYPPTPPKPEDELYLAVAQVAQSSDLSAGIPRLTAAIEKYRPERNDYSLQLASAWRKSGRPEKAIPIYEEILRRNPKSVMVLENLALSMLATGDKVRATQVLEQASDIAPESATVWDLLGSAWVEQNRLPDAVAAFEKAIQLDPNLPEARNSLGGVLVRAQAFKRAEQALRKALELDPNYAQAHANLANLLASTARFEEARFHFEAALRSQPGNSDTRYDYAVALARANQMSEAQRQIEAAIAADANSAQAHEFLGTLLAAQGQLMRAIPEYREAVRIRPEFARANLHLGESLADSGDRAAARAYLEKAAASSEKAVRDEAQAFLKKLDQAH
jgi:predicted CXXCH cytochrome family protein